MSGNEEFQVALAKLRKDFPMCYVEAWTPEDFSVVGDGREVEWDSGEALFIAETLYDEFDANVGTNWDVLEHIKGGSDD